MVRIGGQIYRRRDLFCITTISGENGTPYAPRFSLTSIILIGFVFKDLHTCTHTQRAFICWMERMVACFESA